MLKGDYKMGYKLIVMDMDDTLMTSDNEVSAETAKYLMNIQAQGYKVVLASGRPTDGMMPTAKHLKLDQYKSYGLLTSQLLPEMRVLFPTVQEASFSRSFVMKTDSLKQDTVMLVYLKSTKQISKTDQDKLREWLVARIKMKNIKLLIE